MSEPVPFGGWSPTLSGLIPGMPPPRLLEPIPILVIYNYQELKEYRLYSQPYIVRAHYDLVQTMIEDRIAEKHERNYEAWLQWIKDNL